MFYSSDHFAIFSTLDAFTSEDLFPEQYYEKTSLHGNSVKCSVTTVYTTREGTKHIARTVVGDGRSRRRRDQSLTRESSERQARCPPNMQTKGTINEEVDQKAPEKHNQRQRVHQYTKFYLDWFSRPQSPFLPYLGSQPSYRHWLRMPFIRLNHD